MAEDDDDEAFGDFAFAPFPSNSQSNGLNSLVANDEDDEWGDFVQPPHQSKPSETSFNGNHQSDNSVSPTTWVKRSGALPLSIFGDAEEEEEEKVDNFAVAADLNQWKSNGIARDFNFTKVNNGVSNSHSFSIADLYNQYSQVKPENRAGSDSTGKVDLVENGVNSSSIQNVTRSAVAELKNIDLNDTLGISDHNQLTNKCDKEEFSYKSYVTDPNEEDLFGGWTQEYNGFSSNLNPTQNVPTSSSDLDMNGQKRQFDGSATEVVDDDEDDDGWEFKDAYSEFPAQGVNNNVGFVMHDLSERVASSTAAGISPNKSLDLFGSSNGTIDIFARSTEPVDYFASSSAVSSTSQELDLIGIQPSVATQIGFSLDTHSIIEQNNNKGVLNHRADVGIEELDEDFGEFTAASAETGPKSWEVSINDVFSPIKEESTSDGKIQEKDMKSNYHRGSIPLSIFGNEEPENDGSSDVFVHQSTFEQRSNDTAAKVLSINDLISNLYSQAVQTSPVNTVQNTNETLLGLSSAISSSNLVNDDEILDDSSWDFKDASQMEVDSEASLSSKGDTNMSISSKLKLNNYVDFYSKLKEELCFVALHHIESLKQAQSNAALSGEDAGNAPLDSEFQMVYKELEQMNLLSEESALQDHHSGDVPLSGFAQVLLEPEFQRLESEYHLSEKLLLVEKDLRSAMELIRHTNTMLNILTIGTLEEQKMYVSLWSEMISACTQELKHGVWIWNQAVEKHVQSQLLSEPQGRKFVLALGEIYRVVVVLGASAKAFKPWILLGLVDSPAIYILLEECHAVWSTSGLEEALSSLSAPTSLDNTSLFKSMKHILGLDAVKLQNYVFAERESRCRLSLLTTGVVPDLKMIVWGNEQCFVTLANLWANLISSDPPKLPQLNLG